MLITKPENSYITSAATMWIKHAIMRTIFEIGGMIGGKCPEGGCLDTIKNIDAMHIVNDIDGTTITKSDSNYLTVS